MSDRRPPALTYDDAAAQRPQPPTHRGAFRGGEWRAGAAGASAAVVDPSTGEAWLEVELAEAAEMRRAVESAIERAQHGALVPPVERRGAIEKIADAVEAHAADLAALTACATGRPFAVCLHNDLPLCDAALRHFARLAETLHRVAPRELGQHRAAAVAPIAIHQPLLSCIEALAPALCCGTPIVLIGEAPAAPPLLRLVELLAESEALRSSVSLLTVAAGAAEGMARAAVDTLAGAQRALPAAAPAGTAIRPALLFTDCDLDQAVEGVVQHALAPALPGEAPGCHVFVEEAIERDALERLRMCLATLRVGSALDLNVELGPLASAVQREAFEKRLGAAQADGVQLERFRTESLPSRGFFAAPALLSGVRPDQQVARQTIAGPALALISFRTPEEAIAKLKATGARLGAATVWSEKAGKALAIARELDSGDVFCNTPDRLTPALTTGSALRLGEDGEVVRLLREADVAAAVLDLQAPQCCVPFSPLCRCKQILQVIGP